jgi:hypothetical protein
MGSEIEAIKMSLDFCRGCQFDGSRHVTGDERYFYCNRLLAVIRKVGGPGQWEIITGVSLKSFGQMILRSQREMEDEVFKKGVSA